MTYGSFSKMSVLMWDVHGRIKMYDFIDELISDGCLGSLPDDLGVA